MNRFQKYIRQSSVKFSELLEKNIFRNAKARLKYFFFQKDHKISHNFDVYIFEISSLTVKLYAFEM